MKKFTLGSLFLFVAVASFAGASRKGSMPFYVYKDAAVRENHYIPAGWMGDYGDLHMDQRSLQKPASGSTCIQIKYSALRKQGAGWAGIYWQDPANNWGDKKGGWDLTGAKKLKFKARGETGKEWIEKFMVGGIAGQDQSSDSASADSGGMTLSKDWKEYEISLEGQDMSEVIGGFGFVVSSDSAPNGEVFYIDDVRYE